MRPSNRLACRLCYSGAREGSHTLAFEGSKILPADEQVYVLKDPEHRLLITINILPLLFIDFEQKLQNQYFHTNLFFFVFFLKF